MSDKPHERFQFNSSVWEQYLPYGNTHNALIRRHYMDLAPGDFYGTAFREARIPPGSVVLDIGCGDGSDMIKISNLVPQTRLIGLEAPAFDTEHTEDKLTHIIDNLLRAGVTRAEVTLGDMHDLPFEDSSIDVVVAASVIQESADKDRVIDEISRVLRDKGLLIVFENMRDNKPLHHSYLETMAEQLDAKPAPPFSSRFTYEIALETLESRSDFTDIRDILQNPKSKRNLKIKSEEEIRSILMSLDTYRYLFVPKIQDDWDENRISYEKGELHKRIAERWPSLRNKVAIDIRKHIRRDGSALETIKRGAIICRAVKTPDERKMRFYERTTVFESLGRIVGNSTFQTQIKERPCLPRTLR